jgi:copper(I)-binding protein
MSRFVMPVAVGQAALQEGINDHSVEKMGSVPGLHAASGREVALPAVECQITLIDVEDSLVTGTAFVVPARFAYAGRITTAVSEPYSGAAMPPSGMRSSRR